jgi:glycosyltransferase involved in cell wall biosynthesis
MEIKAGFSSPEKVADTLYHMADQDAQGVIAYACTPHEGGTTTFYRNFAKSLRALGWRVFSVTVGRRGAQLFDPRFGDEHSVLLAPETTDLTQGVKAFFTWLEREQVDILIPNNDDVMLTAIPHMPPKIRYISICHSTVRLSYLVSSLYPERLSFAVAINRRQVRKLFHSWGVPKNKIRLIPTGIPLEDFQNLEGTNSSPAELRLLYLGRINDIDKGVLWIPAILRGLAAEGIPFSCRVVGSGPDLESLQRACRKAGLGEKVQFTGQVVPEDVPALLTQADILLMPSRFEGLPLVLLEAMAAGCVPIATRLKGITDMIVEDGVHGFLCSLGITQAFTAKIAVLHRDRRTLETMSAAARQRVVDHFSLGRMAADYNVLFTESLAQPPPVSGSRPFSEMRYPKALLPTWRTKVPMPLKKLARTYLYWLWGNMM